MGFFPFVPKKSSGEITSAVSCKCLILRAKLKVKLKVFRLSKWRGGGKFLKLFAINNKRKTVCVCAVDVLIMVCVVGWACGAGL